MCLFSCVVKFHCQIWSFVGFCIENQVFGRFQFGTFCMILFAFLFLIFFGSLSLLFPHSGRSSTLISSYCFPCPFSFGLPALLRQFLIVRCDLKRAHGAWLSPNQSRTDRPSLFLVYPHTHRLSFSLYTYNFNKATGLAYNTCRSRCTYTRRSTSPDHSIVCWQCMCVENLFLSRSLL